MSRFLLAFILMSPAVANEPTIDQLHKAYMEAGWYPAMSAQGPAICIAAGTSQHVDRVVFMLAQRAKGVRCS